MDDCPGMGVIKNKDGGIRDGKRETKLTKNRPPIPRRRQMLIRADELGIGTAFSRADDMAPCNIGGAGMCCKICGMGPCRLTKDGQTGVCGATIDTIQARNFIRAIAAGAAAHSDHGRDMAFTLKAVANGETEGYMIRDVAKLRIVAATIRHPDRETLPARNRQRPGRPVYRPVWAAARRDCCHQAGPQERQEIWERPRVMPARH